MARIEVTQRHIRAGKPIDTCACPVALALKATARRNVKVTVGNNTASVGGVMFKLPKKVRKFIFDFDRCDKEVAPISFSLRIPPRLLKVTK